MTKLIQLNMWAGRLDGVLKDYLKREQPDILCLQEALSYPSKDAGFFLTVENIQDLLDLRYTVIGPMFTFNLMNNMATWGNCIISKYPIKKSEVTFTRLGHTSAFDFNDHDGNVRNFVHASINIGDRTYEIITHHGHWVSGHKNGDQETERQMRLLAEYVAGLSGNIILTGDFNLAPHSASLEQLNQLLQNLSIKHRLKTTRTPLTHKTEVCDYIFVSDNVEVASFRAEDHIVSDHKALVLEF